MPRARWLSLVLAGLVLLPVSAHADEPVRVAPEKKSLAERRAARRTIDLSRGGTRRGGLELALGSVATVVTLLMIGRGAWEFAEGSKLLARCREDEDFDPLCRRELPAFEHRLAAGLSFGLAVPVAVASVLLFVRGARTYRQWKAFKTRSSRAASALRDRNMTLTAVWRPEGSASIGLRIAF